MTYYPGPGYRMAAAAHGDLRASDQDRERAAEVLKTGYAEGRVDKDEYDTLLGHVYSARTVGDLARLTSQLPGGGAALLPVPAGPPRTNSRAVASMICGLAEFFTFGLTSIPAVILGHIARGEIRRTGEAGHGFAMTGLVLGWLAIGLWLLFWAGVLVAGVAGGGHGVVYSHGGPAGP
ncbi:MAG TPA: DUF1707 and DUF4190 domain-containing protein [Streptosporangiaceae bacterium]